MTSHSFFNVVINIGVWWLPVPETERTIASAIAKFPIYLQFIKQKLCIIFGESPYNIKTDKRITKRLLKEAKPAVCKPSPLAEAMKYGEVLKEPSIVSNAQVANRFGVSRARVCQMLNLLDLDYSIVNYLCTTKNAKEVNYFTERRLRPLTCIPKQEQLEGFKELLYQLKISES